jgi:hypothetical protein
MSRGGGIRTGCVFARLRGVFAFSGSSIFQKLENKWSMMIEAGCLMAGHHMVGLIVVAMTMVG